MQSTKRKYMPLMALDSQLYTTHQRDYFHASESEMSGLHFHYLCHASTLQNYKKLAQARVNAMRPIIIYNKVSKKFMLLEEADGSENVLIYLGSCDMMLFNSIFLSFLITLKGIF
ncbi:hypothetical protein ACJX0J_032009 [Zea mays]